MTTADALRLVDEKKREIDAAGPLPPETRRSIKADFTIRYAHETTAIEGNTLSIGETAVILEDGIAIGGKSIREHLEVLNIRDALDWLEDIVRQKAPLTEDTILEMHRLIMAGILKEEAGRYRRVPVYIRGTKHVPLNWAKVPQVMENLLARLRRGPQNEHPVVFAAEAHIDLTGIHPFMNGNGRTARLLTSLLLMRSGYPPAMYSNASRQEYLEALDEAYLTCNARKFIAVTARAVEFMEDRYLAMFRPVREAESFLKGHHSPVDP